MNISPAFLSSSRRAALLLLLCMSCLSVGAYTLDEVKFGSYNTYVTDINNNGFVCGYYTGSTGTNVGFVISPEGTRSIISGGMLAGIYTDATVEGINDDNELVIKGTFGTTTAIFLGRFHIDVDNHFYYTFSTANNVQQPNPVAQGINNYGDVAGYYTGGTSRWAFADHDSVTPAGQPSWNAGRFATGSIGNYTYYNTYGTGINDLQTLCGYYIDGANIVPVLYDNNNNYFVAQTSPYIKTHLYDINNSNVVVGDFLAPNGYYTAFWAQASFTGTMTIHPMSPLFNTSPIQSSATGINGKGEIVGTYVMPTSGQTIGFIYRPAQANYRMDGFVFNRDTWSVNNNPGLPNSMWQTGYYGGSSYLTQDPYANNGVPLIDSQIRAAFPSIAANGFPDFVYPTWKSAAQEEDAQGLGVSNNPNDKAKYLNIFKPAFFSKYYHNLVPNTGGYPGACHGFVYSELIRFYREPEFDQWYSVPVAQNIFTTLNTDKNAMRSIERNMLKQSDNPNYAKFNNGHYMDISPWMGAFRLKNNYNKQQALCHARGLAFEAQPGGRDWHIVTPYKICTPQTMPFISLTAGQQYDTVFIHDSNFPADSTQYLLINYPTGVDSSWDAIRASNTQVYNPDIVNFNEPDVYNPSDLHEHSQFKPTYFRDTLYTLSVGNTHYNMYGNSGELTTRTATTFTNANTHLIPVAPDDQPLSSPNYYLLDSLHSVKFSTSSYTNSMEWNQSAELWSMAISRLAAATQSDNGSIDKHSITYGTHDAAAKTLACSFNEYDSSMTSGVSLVASGLGAASGDSIITRRVSKFNYQIIRLGGTAGTYNLIIKAIINDTVKAFSANNIPIGAGTSHIINPYFSGPHGLQPVIFVDNGNNGSNEDTLFLTQVPLGVNDAPQLAGIRVYPNPASREVSVQGNGQAFSVRLTDLAGRELQRAQSSGALLQVSIESLPAGLYFVAVRNAQGEVIHLEKLVKE